jgi:hypothetical protein
MTSATAPAIHPLRWLIINDATNIADAIARMSIKT